MTCARSAGSNFHVPRAKLWVLRTLRVTRSRRPRGVRILPNEPICGHSEERIQRRFIASQPESKAYRDLRNEPTLGATFRIRVPRRSQQNGFLRNEANQLSRFICRGRTKAAPMNYQTNPFASRFRHPWRFLYSFNRKGRTRGILVFDFYETNPFAALRALRAFVVQRAKLPNEPIYEIRGPKHPKSERGPKSEGRTDSAHPIRFLPNEANVRRI
jgi:hypothetical protein